MAAARGRHDRALELFGRALERTSEPGLRAVALRGLAEAELGHFRAKRALEHAEAAVALDPADPASRMLRGVVRKTMGNEAGARDDLRAAAEGPDPGVAAEASAALATLDEA
jgi:Flp pilus assembly protein TadD